MARFRCEKRTSPTEYAFREIDECSEMVKQKFRESIPGTGNWFVGGCKKRWMCHFTEKRGYLRIFEEEESGKMNFNFISRLNHSLLFQTKLQTFLQPAITRRGTKNINRKHSHSHSQPFTLRLRLEIVSNAPVHLHPRASLEIPPLSFDRIDRPTCSPSTVISFAGRAGTIP